MQDSETPSTYVEHAEQSSLRTKKKESTRIALAQAAMRLCHEHSYAKVTVTDIVDAVGVSRRTFSNYFSSKAECVASILDGHLDDLIALFLTQPPDDNVIVELKRTLAATPDEFWQHCSELSAMITAEPELQAFTYASDQRTIDYATGEVAARIGAAADDLRLRITINAIAACVKECVNHWLATDSRGEIGALVELIIDNLDVINTSWIDELRHNSSTAPPSTMHR